jgi:nucleoside-diphosphate-sugar epimerase
MVSRSSFTLVTGATGFVGLPLVAALLARGERVRAMGRNPAALAKLAALGAEPVAADLCDRDAVIAACSGAGTVFHVGAFSAPWGPRATFEVVNVEGTAAVLEGCRRQGVSRLVHVSSPSVVFNGKDQTNLPEDAPYPSRFVSVYSETKKRAEDLVNAAHSKVPAVIVRPKAVFGPGDTSLLPRLITAAKAGRLPQIGAGANRVDLTYVDNVVHALLLAADTPDAIGKTYTITNGEPAPPLWEVIRTVLRGLGLSTDLRRIPLGLALAAATIMEGKALLTGKEPLLTRYSVQILARTQTYDISRAKHDLGYAPVVSLHEGIERTIAAFREGGA